MIQPKSDQAFSFVLPESNTTLHIFFRGRLVVRSLIFSGCRCICAGTDGQNQNFCWYLEVLMQAADHGKR